MLTRLARHRVAALVAGAAIVATLVMWTLAGPPLPWGKYGASWSAAQVDGKAIYAANCARCHGAQGEGQPNWKSQKDDGSYPAPPHDGTGHTWHHPDGLLFGIVKNGGGYAAPRGFNSQMPAWKDALSDSQIVSVLEYIKTLWEPWERQSQATLNRNNPYPPGAREAH